LEVKIAEERGKAQKAKAACRAYEYCALDYKEFDEGIMKKTKKGYAGKDSIRKYKPRCSNFNALPFKE